MSKKIQLNKAQNEDDMRLLLGDLQHKLNETFKGAGKKKVDRLHAKGKLTPRERLDLLFDPNTPRLEIGALAGYEMYKDDGGCPSGGVVVELGYIHKRLCIAVANDPTVKAGAWFPITGKKNLRAQEIAMENHIPIVYLVDSAGVYLPKQAEIFPDKEHFGRIFRNNARMSSMGIPQIAAVMGACVAGGAYLPIMSDEALIVQGNGTIFLAGPYLVKAAIGEDIDQETLGGASTHGSISGVTDYQEPDEESALATIRDIVSRYGRPYDEGYDRIEPALPLNEPDELIQAFPVDRTKPYNMREVLLKLVDHSEITEYKKEYGKTIICAYARVDGWAVGIVANNREIVKNGQGEMQFGGVIYSDSADKAARFIMNCNQKKIPLVFLHDVTGFMVGSRSEHGGIIKDGAKMVNAVANSTVPKISIIIGNSYGAGNYAMCGKAYDPRLIYAWPTAHIAVMGGAQAAKVLQQIQVATLKKKGEEPTAEEQQAIFDRIKAKYDEETSPYYAAARLWVDGIIDPRNTRQVISMGIEAANQAPMERFNPGVIQT